MRMTTTAEAIDRHSEDESLQLWWDDPFHQFTSETDQVYVHKYMPFPGKCGISSRPKQTGTHAGTIQKKI